MLSELVDRRYLGAVRVVDASTDIQIVRPLELSTEQLGWYRTPRGNYVITSAEDPDLAVHTDSFASAPPSPLVGDRTIPFTVQDPSGRYLTRRAQVDLPRDPDPVNASNPDSLFQPHVVHMFRAPKAPVEYGWAVVRATIRASATNTGVPGALLRVVAPGDVHMASGLTDDRGEALVAVPGVPVTTWDAGNGTSPATGPVLITEITVAIEVVVDPAATPPPDPDDLEARRNVLTATVQGGVQLASGREVAVEIII